MPLYENDPASRGSLRGLVQTTRDINYLARVIALDQMDYWYDPCGKSGHELNHDLTDISRAAIQRIFKIITDDHSPKKKKKKKVS